MATVIKHLPHLIILFSKYYFPILLWELDLVRGAK